jgi:glycosyltransferase involved in cell wall biosynthesis
MRVLMSHPTGNSNVRAVIAALNSAGMLGEFHTTLAINPEALWLKLIPNSLSEQLLRRSFPIAKKQLVKFPYLETARLILPKLGFNSLVHKENAWASIDSVYKILDKSVAKRLKVLVEKNTVNAVYGYEDGALNTFRQAKKLGLKCIYDLPIAYWETSRKLLQEEAQRLPLWAKTLGGGINDSEDKLQRKTEELELADVVVGPGEFVLNSIPAWAKSKQLIMTPYGSPFISDRIEKKTRLRNQKLRVLFVGSMTQRKGLADLLAAVNILNTPELELVVMGSLMAPMPFYRNQLPGFEYLPNRSHSKVLELMRNCDVLCLPSIVEGRALVMQEAMSQGLPIIITGNTGGADLIEHGKTGFLVPIRSPEAISEKLAWFLDNRHLIEQMGQQAFNRAQNYTWEAYGANIVSALSELNICS